MTKRIIAGVRYDTANATLVAGSRITRGVDTDPDL